MGKLVRMANFLSRLNTWSVWKKTWSGIWRKKSATNHNCSDTDNCTSMYLYCSSEIGSGYPKNCLKKNHDRLYRKFLICITDSDHDYIFDGILRQEKIEYGIDINIEDTTAYFCVLIIEIIYFHSIIIQWNILFTVIIYNDSSLVIYYFYFPILLVQHQPHLFIYNQCTHYYQCACTKHSQPIQ